MRDMKLQQYVLESDGLKMTTWLESGRCKVGQYVTLKDTNEPKRKWKVTKSYVAEIEHDKIGKIEVFGSIQGRSSKN